MKEHLNLKTVLQRHDGSLLSASTFVGFKLSDQNYPGNFLLVENEACAYSFNQKDCVSERKLPDGRVRVTMRPESVGMRILPFKIQSEAVLGVSDTIPEVKSGRKRTRFGLATKKDVEELRSEHPANRTLESVAANWTNSCILGDDETNDCAHFLSDAFIRAGFRELTKESDDSAINEWCDWNDRKNNQARTIRAKEMWGWFKAMAVRTRRNKPKGDGFWAVFQWDPSYSGGHVLLYDSNKDLVYGTGVFWHWQDQYFYQW